VNACLEFRGRLADLLSGRGGAYKVSEGAFGELAWHEHLLECESCRELIEAEEALDELLASLPEPHLPPALTRRLLARLEPARVDAELDLLLDRSETEPVPEQLARNVLARLAGPRRVEREERALDHLLEQVPNPVTPAGLAARVIASLSAEAGRSFAPRKDSSSMAPTPRAHRAPLKIAIAAALLAGVGASAWFVLRTGPSSEDQVAIGTAQTARSVEGPDAAQVQGQVQGLVEAPPDELLASLDLLESWDLLLEAGVEADVNALGPLDELLLGLEMDGRAR
jgi:hypothetical protein